MVSICIIGSIARETNDDLSDRDLLAIGSPNEVEAAVSGYAADGWNVTRYSYVTFSAMAEAHSLFVQHVKQDGRIVRDDLGFLSTVLRNFQAKKDYSQELLSAIKPLHSLSEIERNYWAKLFQSDVLYVTIRNACIFHRATVEEPAFDYRDLISWVSRVANLSTSEEGALLHLRHLKHAYRSRYADVDVSCVQEIGAVSRKLLDYWLNEPCAGVTAVHHSNGYHEVRDLEGRLIKAVDPVYLDKFGHTHGLADFWSAVCNSDPYRPRPKHLPIWTQKVSEFLASQGAS